VRAYRRLALHRSVIVNLRSGNAVRGVLVDERGPLIEIRKASVFEPGKPQPIEVDGTVVIERSNIDFVQVVGEV
jgi:hypothetical protein